MGHFVGLFSLLSRLKITKDYLTPILVYYFIDTTNSSIKSHWYFICLWNIQNLIFIFLSCHMELCNWLLKVSLFMICALITWWNQGRGNMKISPCTGCRIMKGIRLFSWIVNQRIGRKFQIMILYTSKPRLRARCIHLCFPKWIRW